MDTSHGKARPPDGWPGFVLGRRCDRAPDPSRSAATFRLTHQQHGRRGVHTDVVAHRGAEQAVDIDQSTSHQRSTILRSDHQQVSLLISGGGADATTDIPRTVDCFQLHSKATGALHRFPEHSGFERRTQEAELDSLLSSEAAQVAMAEVYTGLPLPA